MQDRLVVSGVLKEPPRRLHISLSQAVAVVTTVGHTAGPVSKAWLVIARLGPASNGTCI